MLIFDKVLKICFILSILFFFFFLGFLANDIKLNRIYENLSFIIDDIESNFNINLQKKFGDRDIKNNLFFSAENKNILNTKLNSNNLPKEKFDHYLLIKHDNSQPVLMDSPNRVVWSWDLSNFRNSFKIIPYHLFGNGDLIIGKFETKGIYKIDKYGNIIWSNNSINHHWIDIQDKQIFIPSRKFVSLPNDLNDNLTKSELINCDLKKSAFDTILILNSDTGKTIRIIDLMNELIKNKQFKNILNKKILSDKSICNDPLHLNDIQKLNKNQLDLVKTKISLSSENILILSLRSLNMILFYDLDNQIINHIIFDLFTEQHSPRLHEDGFLYVFDNNNDENFSKITKIDIKNKKSIDAFETENFKSDMRGRIQFLSNDLFVQSSVQGEIFKIICKQTFFNNCNAKYLYSSNFNFFYPSNYYDTTYSFKKDGIYIGDFYEKDKIKFLD